ncbi:MAG: thiamine pyrophosphate-dependent enzyme, partial [Firmicutes bacterium]|nr:thiamine pyrophosphate-dependent enzyme [Bacillota bacterium]
AQLRRQEGVVMTSLGEGSTNQGEFHEGMNFAAVHRLPLIIVVENNGFAISVPQSKEMAITDVAVRAQGYGMPGVVVRGSDLLAVFEATREARKRALAGEGPTLIEIKTHRFTPHSSDDDDRSYRTAEELKAEKKDDAIHLFRQWMIEQQLWDEQRDRRLRQRVKHEVNDATDFADAALYPDPSTLLAHVYDD